VTLANFNGQNNLKMLDGGAYAATADSGPPLQNATADRRQLARSVEHRHRGRVSKLIVTQQAYAANTKIITTTTQMVSDLLNVIR